MSQTRANDVNVEWMQEEVRRQRRNEKSQTSIENGWVNELWYYAALFIPILIVLFIHILMLLNYAINCLLYVCIRNTQITVRKLSIYWLFRNLDDVAFSFASFIFFLFFRAHFFKRKMSINQKHGRMGVQGIRKLRKMRRK